MRTSQPALAHRANESRRDLLAQTVQRVAHPEIGTRVDVRPVRCGRCRGTGELVVHGSYRPDAVEDTRICPDCDGNCVAAFELHRGSTYIGTVPARGFTRGDAARLAKRCRGLSDEAAAALVEGEVA